MVPHKFDIEMGWQEKDLKNPQSILKRPSFLAAQYGYIFPSTLSSVAEET